MALSLQVGDHVVYPPHGAGVVKAIDPDPTGDGPLLSIHVVHGGLTLRVPLSAAESKGVRAIIDTSGVKRVLGILRSRDEALPEHPQHRRARLVEKTRTGTPTDLAELLRDLDGREVSGKKLSPPERDAVATAKRHLSTEIAFAQGIAIEEAIEMIDKALETADRDRSSD